MRDVFVRDNLLAFTDIRIELVVRDESNTLTYDIGKVNMALPPFSDIIRMGVRCTQVLFSTLVLLPSPITPI